MLRRKTTGAVVLALGVVLFIAGIVDHELAAPKAALCQSGIGQIAQGFDTTVAHDCGLVTALEAAVGWLLVAGILTVVVGAAVLYNSRTVTRPEVPAAPRPAGPAAPRPAAAPSTPPSASPSSADRPWWTQT
jgi:hypothetical protein